MPGTCKTERWLLWRHIWSGRWHQAVDQHGRTQKSDRLVWRGPCRSLRCISEL